MSFMTWLRQRVRERRAYGAGRRKQYDSTRWEERLPVDALQAVYDNEGWTGPKGQSRAAVVLALAARIRELSDSQRSAVTVLDAACFSGEYFGRLAAIPDLATRFLYTGLDVTPSYIAYASRRWSAHPTAKFVCGSVMKLPYPDAAFDIVLNGGMLIHVDDVRRCLAELSRVARSYLVIETTVRPNLAVDFVDDGKSGSEFIDRVYRHGYVRDLVSGVGEIVAEDVMPYDPDQSVLFQAVPKRR